MRELNIKVMGYLRCIQQAVPYMIANRWGRIVNIAGLNARSTGDIVGSIRNVGVAAMSKHLADALGRNGINVTTIYPSATRTESTTTDTIIRGSNNVIGRI